jgi:hypothetical protein
MRAGCVVLHGPRVETRWLVDDAEVRMAPRGVVRGGEPAWLRPSRCALGFSTLNNVTRPSLLQFDVSKCISSPEGNVPEPYICPGRSKVEDGSWRAQDDGFRLRNFAPIGTPSLLVHGISVEEDVRLTLTLVAL